MSGRGRLCYAGLHCLRGGRSLSVHLIWLIDGTVVDQPEAAEHDE